MLWSSLPVVFLTYALIFYSSLNHINEILLFRELKYLFSDWMEKMKQQLYRAYLLAYYNLLGSNIFELQSSIGRQSNLNNYGTVPVGIIFIICICKTTQQIMCVCMYVLRRIKLILR
jgi:hypothetical protein